jgi:hypothetical protein
MYKFLLTCLILIQTGLLSENISISTKLFEILLLSGDNLWSVQSVCRLSFSFGLSLSEYNSVSSSSKSIGSSVDPYLFVIKSSPGKS